MQPIDNIDKSVAESLELRSYGGIAGGGGGMTRCHIGPEAELSCQIVDVSV